MAGSPDPATSATRLAANLAAASVVVYAVLWLLTTQVDAVRAVSPFADDPWDAIASYAAIFLPLVAGATWIRSLRHRSAVLRASTARRIRWGAGLAAAIVLVATTADVQAIVAFGFPPASEQRGVVIALLVAVALATSIGAILMTAQAARVAPSPPEPDASLEPDLVEDLLALVTDVSRPIGLRVAVGRIAVAIDTYLDGSRWSPRRHRVVFGVLAAGVTGIAYAAWHALREGPPPNPGVLVVFAVLMGGGVLAAYLGTVGPLRLLRPPRP